ncbi:MAG TPA: trypsin-like serine protease [Actinomycetota bacterium]|nr:trypsin-like serine protease [Actinomycetota bacterium]
MRSSSRFTAFLVIALLAVALVAPAEAKPRHNRTKSAGIDCKLIGVPKTLPSLGLALPVGIGPCPGVRPGALVQSEKGYCTFNFLFTGSDGHRYMGTAGHCILGDSQFVEEIGEETWAPGSGPVAMDGDGNRIGEFAYAILFTPKDFALIRLDPGVEADPQMCHFGGPTGTNVATSGSGLIHHRGNGLIIGDVLPARTSLAMSYSNPDTVYANGAALPGDSGGGVISPDGKAVGALVSIGVGGGTGVIGITRLAPQVAQAQQVLGITLTLQTAAQL